MFLPALFVGLVAYAAPQRPVKAELFVAGLNSPLFVCSAPGDDASRVFVSTKGGQIVLVVDGTPRAVPFIDLSARLAASGEGGLLGMCFHPNFAVNRFFFVNYTNRVGDTVIERYEADPLNPDLALLSSARGILHVAQPFTNHNGGWIGFGPDGYLYVPLGDGGSVGDPGNRAQNGQELLGKILRLDIDAGSPYTIPPSNPFVGDPNVRDEIWAIGMRNPWRCDFDPLTGDLWIGDVGQTQWESVDFIPAEQGGRNLGWRIMEGSHCYDPPTGCNSTGLSQPVYEYAHGGNPYRCSIIGGIVYRGRDMATMHGRYFFSDYCSGETWSMRRYGATIIDFADHSGELPFNTIVSMGEDADGEAYVCADFDVYKLVPAGLRLQVPRLSAGNSFASKISGGIPYATSALFFSREGLRRRLETGGNLLLGISAPILIGVRTTDGAGTAVFSSTVPLSLQNRLIWVQAAQFGLNSNVVVTGVE
ncbi:MAG: PQQ-dependent sugar dehydrogenase [Planctomycetota bacterium]|nr:PQQ-dependent sugar dehydrogenase [Planctomycetota bacterium]